MVRDQLHRRVRRAPTVLTALMCILAVGCTAQPRAEDPTPSAPAATPAARASTNAVDFAAMQKELARRLTSGDSAVKGVRSVLVSVDGKTVVSYYRDQQATGYAHVYSVTKSVISILVGIAIDEGRLSGVDQTLAELLPKHRARMSPEVAAITLRQLLTMTAAVPEGGFIGTGDAVGQMLAYGLVGTPGESFVYSDNDAHLVAAGLAEAIDEPILDFARRNLFDPLAIDTRPAWQGSDTGSGGNGFDKPGFAWATDGSEINLGGYGLKLTTPDLIKLGELFVNGGTWRGRRLVSAQWVSESTKLQLTSEQQKEGPYGYFWWLGESFGQRAFVASGLYGQNIIGFPDAGLVIAVASDGDIGPRDRDGHYMPIIEELVFKPLLG